MLSGFAFACVGIAYVAGWSCGRGGRGYFSPGTLQSRTQSEVLLPLADVPLYRSSSSYHTTPLAAYLIAKGHWTPRVPPEPLWIGSFRWNQQWRSGTAPLHKELVWCGQDWIDWSERHPDVAGELWPQMLRFLRKGDHDGQRRAHALLLYVRGCKDSNEYREMVKRFGLMEADAP